MKHRLHDHLKCSILLISYIYIRNPRGPNFDPLWIIVDKFVLWFEFFTILLHLI